jgi:amino-acid N-acetyltransferase
MSIFNINYLARRENVINIRVSEEKDKKKILELINEEKIKITDLDTGELRNSMVVCDGERIIGYSNYIKIPNLNIAFVDMLIINNTYRGQYMGDGLIKSLLNLADKRQIKKVYAIKENNNSAFFKKVGLTKREFKPSEDILKYIKKDLGADGIINVFEAILPDFFNKACKSKG